MTNLKPFQFFVLTFTNLKSADPRLSSSTGQRGLETAISQLTQVGDPPCVGGVKFQHHKGLVFGGFFGAQFSENLEDSGLYIPKFEI